MARPTVEMKIKCPTCTVVFNRMGRGNIFTHVKDVHDQSVQSLYMQYYNCDHGMCKECSKPTLFISFKTGYNRFCSKQCQGKYIRRDMKLNYPEKELAFRSKISEIVTEEWKTKDQSNRIENVSATLKNNASLMTEQERKERYGWLNRISNDERITFIHDIMMNTGAHRWWKTASEDEKQEVIERRANTLRETWDTRGEEIMQKQSSTFFKNTPPGCEHGIEIDDEFINTFNRIFGTI